MPSELLPAVEINPSAPVTASVIFLHGLGADGHDLAPLAAEMNLGGVRFVFPHAPIRPVTINGGYRMRAWYDIASLDIPQGEDEAGIRESEQQVCALIQRELDQGVAADRIVLAGFSQGGAIALHTGLRYPQRLAGMLALSCYLPLAASVKAEAQRANAATPVMMAHGTEDDIVPFAAGEKAQRLLAGLGHTVVWRAYPMPHTLCAQEIQDVSAWLKSVLQV
ncbi:MAG: alpha/beta hydrolase-fold protein [Gammaproteobacteria bacterium]|nr:alpha/beta hydrolase-fold protein [Gammaproteobacteria bacterium]